MAFNLLFDEGENWILTNDLEATTLYIGLGNTADVNTSPAETDTMATITELSGSGYARQSCVFTLSGSTATGAQVTFSFSGTPTGGNATYWFANTNSTGTTGKLLFAASLSTSRTYVNGDTQKVTPAITAA